MPNTTDGRYRILISCIILLSVLLVAFAFIKPVSVNDTSDGVLSNFKIAKAGDKEWMASNLGVSRFANGDPILQAKTAEEWKKAGIDKQPAWCYYNNDPKNDKKYGKLYNWYAVSDPRSLAPKGWHIPSDTEWNDFPANSIAGGLRGTDNSFSDIDTVGFWWSATPTYDGEAWCRFLIPHLNYVKRLSHYKYYGLSVRCIKD